MLIAPVQLRQGYGHCVSDTSLSRLHDLLAAERNRGFGDVTGVSHRARQPFSSASLKGAENLLRKAHRALHDGDRERATAYVARAVSLPYDEHEEMMPAAGAATMEIFNAVTDVVEDVPEGDESWLDAAIAVLEQSGDAARFAVRDVLRDIDNDYRLPGRERRRLRAAITNIPERVRLPDLELTPEELQHEVLATLETVVAYEAAVDALDSP